MNDKLPANPARLHSATTDGATRNANRQRETDATTKRSQKETAGRLGVLNDFVDVSMRKLSRAEIAVWFVLYRDVREGIASTSQRDIAHRAGISDRTVRRIIERLVACGLVSLVYRGGLNRGASKYHVQGASTT